MANSSFYQYVDFTEFLLAKILSKNLSSNAILNIRVVINLIVKLVIYFAWHHEAFAVNDEEEIWFAPYLWIFVDIQIYLDKDYIIGIQGDLYKRQRNYKITDILYDAVVLAYIYSDLPADVIFENDTYSTIISIVGLDAVLNFVQLIKQCCSKKAILNEQEASPRNLEENNNYGGYRLFFFSIILGSIFAFYQYYQLAQKYDGLVLFIAMIGQIVVDLIAVYVVRKTELEFSSSLKTKNMLLVAYGLVVGMMNFTISVLIGFIVVMYFICKCCEDKRRVITDADTGIQYYVVD